MSKKGVRLVILCEDRQQAIFARRYFQKRGFHPNEIILKPCPKDKQSGEQYVRLQYPEEVKAYRSKSNHQQVNLAIVIDADMKSVDWRLTQLDQSLTDAGQQKRTPSDKIAIFVPKRNIETWIHYLQGVSVNETDTYSKLDKPRSCKTEVEKLARELCPLGLPTNAPPALHQACGELKRILI